MSASFRKTGQEVLPRLEPLWLSLHRHHAEVAPQLGAVRAPADSWGMRRADYEAWFAAGDCFVVVAEAHEQLVAYAFVRVRDNRSDTWVVDSRVAEVETLCVMPDFRGQRLGERLLDFVYAELENHGVQEVSLHVIASNAGALRFYGEQGFEPTLVTMSRKLKQ